VGKEVSDMREVGGLVGGRVVGWLEEQVKGSPKKSGVKGGAKKNLLRKKKCKKEKWPRRKKM